MVGSELAGGVRHVGVMMAAMMLPSAAPMLMCFSALNRRRGDGRLSPMMVSRSPVFSAALPFIAGIFQFSPIKHSCLRACRSPRPRQTTM
jgi:predicted metal-binding membrane protein